MYYLSSDSALFSFVWYILATSNIPGFAVLIYGIAALSDVLDRKIARKYNMTLHWERYLIHLDKLMTLRCLSA